MSKNKNPKKYFKLGPSATSFYSPLSTLKIVGPQVCSIDSSMIHGDNRVKNALTGGHIIEVPESEFNSSDYQYNIESEFTAPSPEKKKDEEKEDDEEDEEKEDDEKEDDDDDDDDDDEDEKPNPPHKTPVTRRGRR